MKNFASGTFILACMLLLSGCNLPLIQGTQPPLAPPGQEQQTQTHTFQMAEVTLTPSQTPAPPAPLISVSVDTNCRTGPGQVYDYLGGLMVGEQAEVSARDPSGRYWYIRNPDGPGFCWVWAEYATVVGDTGPLPVFTPLPTPTPLLDFSFAFNSTSNCAGHYYIELLVTNTGALVLESYSLFVRNDSHALSTAYADNRFADIDACGAEPPSANIAPGGTGHIGTMPFMDFNPAGDSFFAELTMCTQDDQGGQCLTRTITFVP